MARRPQGKAAGPSSGCRTRSGGERIHPTLPAPSETLDPEDRRTLTSPAD
ncbi:hypothetical protein HMPREF9440_02135 [Sutterella parvirubra YIT 11816]|uniref:Uncharacterized protein n=1 Tax=Sutterella parvirubra YIT 11816 TaxID=762967 RepID=H3KH92_9BURK|nr:hypothetical protein HMPREF9440_02135 [Sutterella parvirubra YIT 11816]